ncbi:hypothetical protein ACFWA9_10170 [Kitasatospora sp. NPDC059973]|uniref:hypothetical protein n=1 Tax=Kitasatospora sp. NPDC059973 TaxID=3347020 RepID=UPI00367CA584
MTPTQIISEQPQQLAENVHYAGALYLADGIRVTRQYPAESYDPPAPYQDTCPCCGDTCGGVTSGIITPPDETAPLQRVTWDDGGVSAMPPHLLKRA